MNVEWWGDEQSSPPCRVQLGAPLAVGGLPIDGLLVAGVEVVVAAREGFGAEEAAVRGERRGVRGFDDAVLAAVDEFFLGAGVAAPEYEDQVLSLLGEGADGLVGECFPALVAVRASVVRGYCEDAIE